MTKEKAPPKNPIKSVQYDLFSQFLTNTPSNISNSIELWESIPKYVLSGKEQNKLRGANGLAKSQDIKYCLIGKNKEAIHYTVTIQPALIRQKDGSDKAFFPTKTEETVEEVLKKIFTEQQYAIHDPAACDSRVRFSYNMIMRELKNKGCGKSYPVIKHALEVMKKCVITVIDSEGTEVYSGGILQDYYTTVNRANYLDNPHELHAARLPEFISRAINNLQYRQYNYKRLMECNEQLARFLLRRLINRYTNANYDNSYHFMLSSIKRESGLLRMSKESDNRRKVVSALDELKNKMAIYEYSIDERKEGRKLVDVKYTIKPSMEFINEQKTANKHKSNLISHAKNKNLPVDNFL